MSDGQILDELNKERKALKSQVERLSDAAHVHGHRFIQLGQALAYGKALAADFPFEYCDAEEARRIVQELPDLRERLRTVTELLRRRTEE